VSLGVVVSCEHGGNRVPARYRELFTGADRELASHAGWDPGSARLARDLARACGTDLVVATVSRLVVDLNRGPGHRRLFSRRTRDLPEEERERILARYWEPHRAAVVRGIRAHGRRTVLHLSVHSFTPRWKGAVRAVDVGLLYDPARPGERVLVDRWLGALGQLRPDLRLRRNYPYLGVSPGMTTDLRRRFAAGRYLGIEVEVNQALVAGAPARWRALRSALVASLQAALAEYGRAPRSRRTGGGRLDASRHRG